VGDVITVGADTTKTISAIDYTTNTITVSDAAFTVADNDVVFCETANEGLPEMILMDTVSLRDSDNVTAVDGLGVLASAADVTVESLLGDVASMLADATAKSNIIHKFKLWNSTTQRYSSAGLTG
jgi:hypothetical protein